MKPDLLEGPGPGEEDSGLLHGGSMRMTENEEMGKGGDSETDLERKDQKGENKVKATENHNLFLFTYMCMYIDM